MARTLIRTAALLFVAVLGTGCAALNVKQPTASIRSADVQDMTADGVTVNFDVNVQNPNSVAIPLSAAKYKLAFSGVEVLSDEAKPEASIPANGSVPVKLPVHLNFQRLVSAEQAIAKSGGNVPYSFDGTLEFTPGKMAGLPMSQPVRVPVKYSDTLHLRDMLTKAAQDPQFLTNPDAQRLIRSILGGGLLDNVLGGSRRGGK